MIVFTQHKEKIVLNDKTLSSGGEGEIHAITESSERFRNCCAKIYYLKKRTSLQKEKIKYMANNPPSIVRNNNFMLGWPIEYITDQEGNFIGFIMPLAFNDSKQLVMLTTTKVSKKLNEHWHYRFNRDFRQHSTLSRLKLLCNIAVPIHILHSTKKYVLKDLKPENILITYDGKVTIVDMDSVQISEQGNLLYPGTAATPNYIPPEYYVLKNKETKQDTSWDDFALGVIFYQVLIGLHPYVVTPCDIEENTTNEIYSNIAKCLFPFGEKQNQIQGYPPIHNNFKELPTKIQQLFMRTFSCDIKLRPTAEEWGKSLYEVVKANVAVRTPHLLGSYVCPTCKRKIEVLEDDVLIYDSTRIRIENKIKISLDNTYVFNGHIITVLNYCPYDNILTISEQKFLEQEQKNKVTNDKEPIKKQDDDKIGCGTIIGIILFIGLIILLMVL